MPDLRRLPALAPWPSGKPVRIVRPQGTAGGPHVFHTADEAFAVYDTGGALLAGPLAFSTLWREAGPCRSGSSQILITRNDARAQRWLLSRWASPEPGPSFHLCFALSRTSDPVSGGWYLCDFPLPMYRAGSEIEVGVDAYSLPIDLGSSRVLFAFDRNPMLEGRPVAYTRTLPDLKRPMP